MKVLLVAEESAGIRCLRQLVKSGRELVGVVASPTPGDARVPSVWGVAQTLGLRCWPIECVKQAELARTLEGENLDVLLNIHSLRVIHESSLEAARYGGFNLHPGPLPRYAGLNAPSWAIYNGETCHSVTLHKMAAGIDTGPIVFESSFDITEADTGLSVMTKCVESGLPLVQRLLETLEQDPDSLPLVPQDLSRRRYFGREVPHAGRLCWEQPAERVVRFVCASDYYPFTSPWGHPTARMNGCNIGILKARPTGRAAAGPPGTVMSKESDGVTIACLDDDIIVRLVLFEGKVAAARDVLQVGQRLFDG